MKIGGSALFGLGIKSTAWHCLVALVFAAMCACLLLCGCATEEQQSQSSDQEQQEQESQDTAQQGQQDQESKSSDAETAQQVSAVHYSFSIPDYWVDRATVSVSGDEVTIYSKEYPSRDLCSLSYVSQPAEDWGDIGGSIMAEIELDDGGYVDISATRWAYIAGDVLLNGDSYSGSELSGLTQAEAEELIDLQTGGEVSYQELKESVESNGLGSSAVNELVFEVDSFLSSTIAPTITSA